MKKLSAWLLLALLTGVCLYLGIGGLSILELEDSARAASSVAEGDAVVGDAEETFRDAQMRELALEQEAVERFFGALMKLPRIATLCLTAFAFGCVGGGARLVHQEQTANTLCLEKALSYPVLGGLVGLIVLGVSFVVPTALIRGTGELQPIAVLFVCLIGGVGSQSVVKFIVAKCASMFGF